MHGLPFSLLQTYVQESLSSDAWPKLLKMAGLAPTKLHFNNEDYPDEEFFSIAQEVCLERKMTLDELLFDLGKYLAKHFFKNYSEMVDPSWTALDLLERSPYFFEKLLNAAAPKFRKGNIRAKRENQRLLKIYYTSSRRLCPMVEGVFTSVIENYKEDVHLDQIFCLKKGDDLCEFIIRKGQNS